MHKKTFFPALIFILLLGHGCIDEPEYADQPEISFSGIEIKPISRQAGLNIDSVGITINFTDGNGDLGLAPEEGYPEYGEFETDAAGSPTSVPNKFRDNYFINVFRKEGGTFQPVTFEDGQEFGGRFPRLNTLGNDTSLEGEIFYSLQLFFGAGTTLQPLDTLRFQVQIADRAKNLSNIIETDPVVIGQ